MQTWKTISCTPEQQQVLYRECGLFCTKKQKLDVADLFYNKSLDLNSVDPKALYFRSKCKRHIAQTEAALVDAQKALALDDLVQPYNLEVCDGLYEQNKFEDTKINLSNFSRKFVGKKVNAFKFRLDVVDENFNDALGDPAGYFILEHGKGFDQVHRKMQATTDQRPLWRIHKEQQNCDVLSIPEIKMELLSPKGIAKRNLTYRVFTQTYFRQSWNDILFLKALQTKKDLLLPQSHLSRPIMEDLTTAKYDAVSKFLKMLHSRTPFYTERMHNAPDPRRKKLLKQANLYRIQYQVHRNVISMLKTMHHLRATRQLKKLTNYVEEVMGDYMVLKTHKVMPWKFKFINEVYNLLALAFCDQFDNIPTNLTDNEESDRLIVLLKLHLDFKKERPVYEFGNRDTFLDEDATDKASMSNKALLSRLEKRLILAKYPIERAYLWCRVSRIDFQERNHDKSILSAEKCIAEARKVNSHVWAFLATVQILKVHAVLRKVEKAKATIERIKEIAELLKSPKIEAFFSLCYSLNMADLVTKKKLERAKSMASLMSLASSRSKSIEV